MATTRIRALRRFTTRIVNPPTRLFAAWLPGYAILTYVGRGRGGRIAPH